MARRAFMAALRCYGRSFGAGHESAYGTKRHSAAAQQTVAIGGKADMATQGRKRR
jgi:hypothetical protein